MQPEVTNATQACGTLVVLSVRNAYDWARALFGICYCCTVSAAPAGVRGVAPAGKELC